MTAYNKALEKVEQDLEDASRRRKEPGLERFI
jgi:hypothetical protein